MKGGFRKTNLIPRRTLYCKTTMWAKNSIEGEKVMRKKFKKLVAMVLSLAILATFCAVPMTASAEDKNLKFGDDGKFKIVVFSDVQVQYPAHQRLITIMEQALEREKPDLVVFNGDMTEMNTKDPEVDLRRTVEQILAPVVEAGVPYSIVFGNHDVQGYNGNVDKEAVLSVYQSIGDCRTTDPAPELTGTGTCKIPIYASNGSNVAFNLWMVDSNSWQNPSNYSGGYDNPHADQLAWMQENNDAGVNSLVFQHIPMPEIYNLLVEDENGDKTYGDKTYTLELNANATGELNEFPNPCPADKNTGEFDALKEMGNVLGVFTGHDHFNNFTGTYEGIDMTAIPGMTYFAYGKEEYRGYGVIELDESNLSDYDYHSVKFSTLDAEFGNASSETTFDAYDEITYSDLKMNGQPVGDSFTINGTHDFTYEATSPSYSAIFKFRWTAGTKQGMQFSFDKGEGGNISYPFGVWIKKPTEAGPNGEWHLNPTDKNLSVPLDAPISQGDTFDIEFGRLKILAGAPERVGQYYLYLKVDGVLIEDTYLNVTEDGNYTSSSALCEVSNVIRFGEWGEGGNVISAIPIPETYEDYDDITYEDLYIAGYPAASSGIDLGSTREYTYNATSESKSAVFKFRWTAGAEAKFALFFDYWGNYAFGASAKAPNGGTGGGVNAGENGAWHIDQRNADNIVQMTEPIAAGDVHDIEYGRLKVKTGDNAGKYYVYLKVDGELIKYYYIEATEELTNKILFVSSTSDNYICATPENYVHDEITYNDLYIAGYPAASSGIHLGSTREYTYNATSETYSTAFKFRWTAGASPQFSLYFDYWGNYPFGLAVKGPNSNKGGGATAGENGAWHLNPAMPDNIAQMTEPIVEGQSYDIEIGRIKVRTGENRGKYNVYLKVDGEDIYSYYVEATDELTNKILFVSSTEDNFICATPEEESDEPEVDPNPDSPYYDYDELTFDDLYIGDISMSGMEMDGSRNYTYNATSPSYSMKLKFRWIAGSERRFTVFLDDWVFPFSFAAKVPGQQFGAETGENGAWHINPANADLMVNMDEPIVTGQAYDIEIGRLKVKNGEYADQYKVYLMVNGEEIKHYYYDGVSNGAYSGTALSNNIIFSSPEGNKFTASPVPENYDAYDELTFDDLFIGNISMSGMEMDGSRNYTYNATSPSYSMKLKFRWIAGSERRFTVFLDNWVYPFSFAAKVPGQQFGAETGKNGAWHINPANADLMVNMDEPIVTGQAYDIEIGRLKVSSGANEGKYKVYLMVNGEEIKHYYYDGVSNGAYSGTALSNNIIFSSPEGNKFTATPFVEEYEAYDEIGYEDLKAADGNALGNQTSMSGATIFTYDKTSATGSVIFKYRWKVGTSAKFQMSFDKTPDSSMSYMFGAWLDVPNENYANGQMWLRPGYSSMANLAEILAVGSSHNVEFARLKVTNGSNAGKYYVYIKIDDVLIAEDYVAADVVDANGNYTTEPNNSTIALSNEIYIAFWGTEGNIISPYKELGSNEHDGTRGDFDGDGTISSIDLITLRKILLGINVGDLPNELGDMNVDGEVNILDLIVMKKELVILSDYSRSGSITLGIQEHLLDDESKTATYIADASATLGANAYRLSMPIHKLFYADSSNNAVLREDNMSQLKELVAELKAKGIEEILYVTDSYILPYGYADATKNHNNTVPDPKTEAENYVAWLTVNAEAFKKLAEEVPEIKFFEPYNEINLRTTRLERNGCAWSTTTEEQAAYKFTVTEKAGIMADLCWYISRAVKSVSTSNQVTTPSISVGSNSIIENDFVEAFYNAIESGVYPTNQSLADVRVDNYFTIINVHAYPDYTEDDALFGDNFESNANAEITEWAGYISYVYEVVKAHDDGSSRVWLTETGMTTYDRDMDNVARLIELALEKVDEELTFVDAVYFYKIADVSTEKGISLSETYFGLFNSGDDLDNPYAAKESAKVIYSFFHNGTTDYSALDELVGRYVE